MMLTCLKLGIIITEKKIKQMEFCKLVVQGLAYTSPLAQLHVSPLT